MKLDSVKDVPLDGETSTIQGPIQYFDALCEGTKRDSKAVYNWWVLPQKITVMWVDTLSG